MQWDFEAMYAACTGRDPRFDGRFYLAVTSTGIYCRPSCPAAKPKRANCQFHPTAASAQAAGFRACKRCVPEALPGSPTWSPSATTVARALHLVDDGVVDRDGVEGLARRLDYSARNLNRMLVAETGAPALAHARARRARLAHGLITSTDLPFADVAFAAGFASIRQFNDTVREVYAASPTELRRDGSRVAGQPGVLRAELSYRPPFDWAALLDWFAQRTIEGIEHVADGAYQRSLRLPCGPAVVSLRDDAARRRVVATFRLTDLRDYGPGVAAVRRLLDLDADPVGIDAALAGLEWLRPLIEARPGLRLPGCPTPFEALLRAITGQQVSVAAGRAQLQRMRRLAAAPLPEPSGPVTHVFPEPADVGATLAEWFTGPGSRRECLARACELAASGALDPSHGAADVAKALAATRGIGPWTIAYTLLRAFNDPDADLSGDGALLAEARRRGLATTAAEFKQLFATARPWRSYAALHLWTAAADTATRPETP